MLTYSVVGIDKVVILCHNTCVLRFWSVTICKEFIKLRI